MLRLGDVEELFCSDHALTSPAAKVLAMLMVTGLVAVLMIVWRMIKVCLSSGNCPTRGNQVEDKEEGAIDAFVGVSVWPRRVPRGNQMRGRQVSRVSGASGQLRTRRTANREANDKKRKKHSFGVFGVFARKAWQTKQQSRKERGRRADDIVLAIDRPCLLGLTDKRVGQGPQ